MAPIHNHSIKLAIFDLDGTLIDSAPDIVDTTNSLLRQYGEPELPEATIVSAIGEGLRQLIHSCFPRLATDEEAIRKIDRDFYKHYRANMVKKTVVFPGIHEFLESSPYKIAIVTNKFEDLTHLTLAKLELNRYPWVKVFGADSLPEKKPHPLPLLKVMEAASVTASETVMIGDGLPDMGAAKAAGIRSLACEYGYCAAEKLIAAGATSTVKFPQELAQALLLLRSPS
jgi:2-phosphoglycolate phosphatase